VSPAAKRDLELTARRLEAALARHLGVTDPVVSGLSSPKAGYSNETMFFQAQYDSAGGGARQRDDLVLRVEPTGHQLFVTPDAARQAKVMTTLARHPGVPVPEILFTESDPAELGAPYFVMRQVHGRVPGDVPSWHRKGWVKDLSPDDQFRVHDNGLAALVALHRIDPHDGFDFLAPPSSEGTALDRYLDGLEQWYEWCGESRHYGADVLEEALAYLLEHRPDDPAERIVWGDARVGNLLYADDLSVAAMFDWEAATLGPPGIDLGWWLMFEDFLSEAQGTSRLPGVPGREATIARYQELGGVEVADIDYYELLACVVMALINSRLADLLIAEGKVSDEVAASYPMRSVDGAERRLAALKSARQ
jgi:aminoglycoside phosphotransferase (APT) family kinase protein